MLTNNDLYEKYGEDIIFLFKGNEPYVEGNGCPLGVLIEKNDKVLCNECGGWFCRLGGHVQTHGMKIEEYKIKYGFNRSAPLCSASDSLRASEKTVAAMIKNPALKAAAIRALSEGHKTMKNQENKTKGQKHAMQKLNGRNSCPEQMKQRYMLLIAKFGKEVGMNILKKYDSGLVTYGQRHFGSWNNYKKTLNLPVDTSSYKKEKADLIYEIRKYVKEYKTLPWSSYTHERLHGFTYSKAPYITQWGSLRRACIACGLTRGNGFLTNTGGGAKEEWFLVD